MNNKGMLHRIRKNAPSLTLSMVFHVLILLVLGWITWKIIDTKTPDILLTLPPDVADEVEEEKSLVEQGQFGEVGNASQEAFGNEQDLLPAAPASAQRAENIDKIASQLPLPDLPAAFARTDQLTAELTGTMGTIQSVVKNGGGSAILRGTSSGFGKYIGDLRGRGLDVVLVIDATESMSPYIGQAKKRLHEIMNVVHGLVPKTRIGVVAYKDYGDDFGPKAVKSLPLSDDVGKARAFINDIIASGGGDFPEPINRALAVATNNKTMNWRSGSRKRVIILVGDSSCHSSGRKKALKYARTFAKKYGGTVNVIDVGGENRETLQPDLNAIAKAGQGSAFLLTDRDAFWRHLIVSVFGERFRNDVEIILKRFSEEKEGI